jgi:hypothetical protein
LHHKNVLFTDLVPFFLDMNPIQSCMRSVHWYE